MISAEITTKIVFDKQGQSKMEEAVFTIREVLYALEKAGGYNTTGIITILEDAECALRAILDGTTF